MLAVVAFSMSMIGTFLVRSGILTSVHSFAVDPQRGTFILVLLALYIGGALALYGLRIGTVRQGKTFEYVSREGALVANNLLLTVILGVVLIGTLYPLVVEALGGRLSIGPPYFNAVTGPVALVLVVIMAVGPLLRWRRDELGLLIRRMAIPVGLTVMVAILVTLLAPQAGIMAIATLALAAGAGAASLAPLWRRNLRRAPLFLWGMVIAHLGISVTLAGIASENAFSIERLAALPVGGSTRVGPWHVTFEAVDPIGGPNWTAVQARLVARRGGETVLLQPQARTFTDPMMQTSEASIATRLDGQLYTVIGKGDPLGRRQLRLWWKPFVTLIWLGGAMIAFGGLLALLGRLSRRRRTVSEEALS
jgi:cytochrome c-type biogenesis protein CcmF